MIAQVFTMITVFDTRCLVIVKNGKQTFMILQISQNV